MGCSKIWGSLAIADSTVTKGPSSSKSQVSLSDQSQRNAAVRRSHHGREPIPDGHAHADLPNRLGCIPANGVVEHYSATGTLDMHGTRRAASFSVSVQRNEGEIDVLADVTIPFSEWGISNPSIGTS